VFFVRDGAVMVVAKQWVRKQSPEVVASIGRCTILETAVFYHLDTEHPEFADLRRKFPLRMSNSAPQSYGLGDAVADAIKVVTFGKVKPCGGCNKRKKWLNKIKLKG